jgi:tetratricopeptide (TPR) repeat protein
MRGLWIGLALALAAPAASAQAQQQRDWCYSDTATDDQTIDGCTALIQSAQETSETKAGAYDNRGFAYEKKHLYDQAIADYRAVLKINPNWLGAWNSLKRLGVSAPFASAASAQTPQQRDWCNSPTAADDQRIEGCSALIQSAQETSATKAVAYATRGAAYVHKGLYDQAIADYTQAIALKPDDAAYQGRGMAYRGKFLHDQAIADFAQAIAFKPDDADAYNNRGLAYIEGGLYDQSIADFTRAIALKRGFAQFHYNRAFAYDVKGHHRDQAVADYRAALKINPNLQAARDGLKRDAARRKKGRGHARIAHHGG